LLRDDNRELNDCVTRTAADGRRPTARFTRERRSRCRRSGDERVVERTGFFEALVQRGSDVVSIDEESTILFANESVERLVGYPPEALVGEPLTKVMPDRFTEKLLEENETTAELDASEEYAELTAAIEKKQADSTRRPRRRTASLVLTSPRRWPRRGPRGCLPGSRYRPRGGPCRG
jgi:PAS domain-containing protein